MCGNCFHPTLIGSGVGKNSVLRQWLAGNEVGGQGAKPEPVATKQGAHSIYSDLVDKVVQRFAKEHPTKPLPISKVLPDLPEFRSELGNLDLPHIAERQLPVNRPVKVDKGQRLFQHQKDAATRFFTQSECDAVVKSELSCVGI